MRAAFSTGTDAAQGWGEPRCNPQHYRKPLPYLTQVTASIIIFLQVKLTQYIYWNSGK